LEAAVTTLAGLHQIISQLDAFINSLYRNNMLVTRYCIEYLSEHVKETTNKTDGTLLIESILFATPKGINRFPDDISDINTMLYGGSKRLSRFLIKN
jgi:hypothetical protein